jgi:hypothetical protein
MTKGIKGPAGEESLKSGTIGVLKSQHKRGARSWGIGIQLTNPRGALRQVEGTVDRVVHRERRMALRRGIRATCNVHTARNPTWVLVVTRWCSVLGRLGDGITLGVTRQRQVTLALLRRAL